MGTLGRNGAAETNDREGNGSGTLPTSRKFGTGAVEGNAGAGRRSKLGSAGLSFNLWPISASALLKAAPGEMWLQCFFSWRSKFAAVGTIAIFLQFLQAVQSFLHFVMFPSAQYSYCDDGEYSGCYACCNVPFEMTIRTTCPHHPEQSLENGNVLTGTRSSFISDFPLSP